MSTTNSGADDRHASDGPLTSIGPPRSDSIDITLSPLSDSTWLSPGSASEPPTIARDFLPGYEILRELHRGGQGIVFLAHQKSVQRNVAIKVVKEGPFADPTDRARFDREVRILAQLQHPNIVTIHDSGRIAGCDYFVMDYVPGMSLDEYVEQKRPPLRQLLELFQAICETVEVAHARNIIHRDLKPGNIRVDEKGRPRVLDFGLAKVVGGPRTAAATEQGMFVGSIPWASPEQARGELETLDPRTDVYSLGVILYQLLTNRFPYDVFGPPNQVFDQILHESPQRPRFVRRDMNLDLETIVLTCLQKDPARRYKSAGSIADDLNRYHNGQPITARGDSFAYVLRTRARKTVSKHRIASGVVSVLIATVLVHYVGYPLVFAWTPLHGFFERKMSGLFPSIAATPSLPDVRVVAFDDRTNMERLAFTNGLAGVTDNNGKSFRRLHGRLMERLAASSCRAIAWDIFLADPTEFDCDFERGVVAANQTGIDVIVAVKQWWLDDPTKPVVSPILLPIVRYGCAQAGLSAKLPWRVQLVAQRGLDDPLPSLALSAFAAAREPGKQVDIQFDMQRECIDLTYWMPDSTLSRLKRRIGASDHVELAMSREGQEASNLFVPSTGLRPGDDVGIYIADVPVDAVLNSVTVPYQDVIDADTPRLRNWFADKVVVIADFRSGKDRSRHPDGRILPGCWAHASAIESLLMKHTVLMPRFFGEWLIPLAAASLGGLVVAALTKLSHQLAACLVVSGLILCASVVAYWQASYVMDAFVPLIAFWLAAGCCFAIRRFSTPAPSGH